MEEDLVQRAAAAIRQRVGLPRVAGRTSTARPAVSPAAYREFLKGRYFRHREEEVDLDDPAGLFDEPRDLSNDGSDQE